MPLTQRQTDVVMGQDTLLHGEALSVIPTTPFFTQSLSSNVCGHMLLIKGAWCAFIIHFTAFLAYSGWESDVRLHPEAANRLRGATKQLLLCFT